jgi:ribosomal protein S18 acetylase RimI-like enzyme
MIERTDDIISLPDLPDVPDLIFRRFRGESDYPGITAAGNASRELDGQEWVLTVDDVAREFDHMVNSDPSKDMIIAEINGVIAGFSRGEWWKEEDGPYCYWFDLSLSPEWRGRGIRSAMLYWVEARLRQVAAVHPADAPKTFTSFVPDKANSLSVLLESEGYRPARYYNKMVRSLEEDLPDFPMPAGLEMRPVLPEHYRLIWEADNEAFRDHWGHVPAQEEYYQEWLDSPVIFTPELWQIAWDVETNEVAGQVRTFIDELRNEKYVRQRGYSEFISVRRPYRKRGLARALIAESLRVLKARGMTESALTVDTENLSGATRLYEECGFRTVSRTTAYRKPL